MSAAVLVREHEGLDRGRDAPGEHDTLGEHADATRVPAALLPLFREVGDLKRVTSAGKPGSIATRLFRQGWADLMAGRPLRDTAFSVTGSALAATRLGDLDRLTLEALGLSRLRAREIAGEAIASVAGAADPALVAACRSALADDLPHPPGRVPPFVEQLAEQPRAGATCPGRARIVLLPAENHAEHCLAVAVYGVLLSPIYGADPATVFLAALAHHLHNAAMPDAGFTGEMLLGADLEPVMARATEAALDELAPALRADTVRARAILPDADTAEGRAFHAADVIDRVLEIDNHLARGRVTMADVLGPMALVHAGPVKAFHDRVLIEVGLP